LGTAFPPPIAKAELGFENYHLNGKKLIGKIDDSFARPAAPYELKSNQH
jgi:hypothetical protein